MIQQNRELETVSLKQQELKVTKYFEQSLLTVASEHGVLYRVHVRLHEVSRGRLLRWTGYQDDERQTKHPNL